MSSPLFIHGTTFKDQLYNDIRDITDIEYFVNLRQDLESLWQDYSPYADPGFRESMPLDINARVWEMYLTCALLERQLPVKPKQSADGPDVLIEQGVSRVWIEAIAPSGGDEGNPDRVPEMPGAWRHSQLTCRAKT